MHQQNDAHATSERLSWRTVFLMMTIISACIFAFQIWLQAVQDPLPGASHVPSDRSISAKHKSVDLGADRNRRNDVIAAEDASERWTNHLSLAALIVSILGLIITSVFNWRSDRRAQREHEWKRAEREAIPAPNATHDSAG